MADTNGWDFDDDALGLNGFRASESSLVIGVDEVSARRLCLKILVIAVIIFIPCGALMFWNGAEAESEEGAPLPVPEVLQDEGRSKESIEAGFNAYIQTLPEVIGDLETMPN